MAKRDAVDTKGAADKRKCFVVGPFGKPNSEARIWSDFLMENVIKFAIGDEYDVCRTIDAPEPGDIVDRIKRDLEHADMVIGDITDHNSNVFYELAIRHAARLPVVQLIRAADRVPFDLNQVRTIRIDTSNIYSLVPRINTYRAEIGSQVRRALEDPDSVDNPITTFYPDFRVQLSSQ